MTHPCDSGDAAAYVLGAMDEQEAQRFRVHLSECAVCRDEVTALSPVASILSTAVPQYPASSALRKRIVAQTRQEQPARPRSARFSLSLPVFAPLASAGLALAVGLLIGALALAPQSSNSSRSINAQVIDEPGATAVLERQGNHLVLRVSGLRAPGSNEIYEVWVRRGTTPEATNSLFSVTGNGSATAAVPVEQIDQINTVMVTAEPLGGTKVPTTPAVIVAHI
jgi:anti-sigma-K factor RskA